MWYHRTWMQLETYLCSCHLCSVVLFCQRKPCNVKTQNGVKLCSHGIRVVRHAVHADPAIRLCVTYFCYDIFNVQYLWSTQ